MRRFYLEWPRPQIRQTLSDESQNPSRVGHALFPLPWSHYVKLLTLKTPAARAFYETEALRGGWSVRQLERQINSQFYERTALSRNKAAMLRKGIRPLPEDAVSPEEEIKDPFVLEFLGLKDEYSEGDLEEALIKQLENFYWNWVGTSPSLAGSDACASGTSGSASTCFSSTAACGAW